MKKVTVRLDDDLHARIEQAAEREKRSLNGQIEWLLKLGLDSRDNPVNFADRTFRLPEVVLEWLREQAEREGRPMTHIVVDALEAYRAGRILPLTHDDQEQGT